MSDTDEIIVDPHAIANLTKKPCKSILKSGKSLDDANNDQHPQEHQQCLSGMTRSESKSHKIPHFDEMNILATYHPADKDYGHMKIEEPKTPFNRDIEEEMEVEQGAVDPTTLANRLKDTSTSSSTSVHYHPDSIRRESSASSVEDEHETPEEREHRRTFEQKRKQHYNEFEIVRQRKKEIDEELKAIEQLEQSSSNSNSSTTSDVKSSILSSHASKDSASSSVIHHVRTDGTEDHPLTAEEEERKKVFEQKRKQHYNEFKVARMRDNEDDEAEEQKS
ncbi:unnamed protein product [Didymodactylos carnosus]|uniref:Protein phosphatase inhibitor 2 n=1 Tax=Didymodactylos carnosus TaxID=1234261 RepID=A0A813WJR1_9BILA|nr:unnamed protein product [Didymodactylos carnosus]CAF3650067.1 unnamed protein product [Didymodactylos carnosus]